MRVLFTVSSWPTHYSAMVPYGWALQALGHEVQVLCAPSQVDSVGATGLVPVPLLDGMSVVLGNRLQYYRSAVDGTWPYPWLPLHPVTGVQLHRLGDFDLTDYRRRVEPELAARAGRSFDAAVEFVRWWRPDLVLHDPVSLEGLLAARVNRLPSALCLWGLTGTREAPEAAVVPEDFSGSFPRYGLHPDPVALVEHVVDPCPVSAAPPTSAVRLPVRYVPYNGSAPAPPWLAEPPDRPRVCVTWSTALSTMSGPNSYVLPRLVRALLDLDVEVVVAATVQDAAALGEVAGPVRVMPRLPLRLVAPTCAAVIHHGGAGSTMTSLWSGVPQLAVTFAGEQAAVGDRIAAVGAGRHLPGHLADRDAITTAVADLIRTGSYRMRAAALREEMLIRPTPVDLISTLEKLTANGCDPARITVGNGGFG
ncbi:nucleotide disphospho-sugar-binding domain-containing protein [Micromonospora sp. NPDC049559]|uniref:nucleotide disphospho-sugar-binding domain-containing protein n=1 Tax=Micromonospora sp. NPDC049559 TaxID=3155923 RepID=UPI00343A3F70